MIVYQYVSCHEVIGTKMAWHGYDVCRNPGEERSSLTASAHLAIICPDKDGGGGHTKPGV